MAANGDSSSWADLPKVLESHGAIVKVNELFKTDGQFQAFTTTNAISHPVTFGIKSSGSHSTLLVTISNGAGHAQAGAHHGKAAFTLSALPEQWSEFFKPIPVMPYQSYWGMFGMNIKQKGIEVIGNADEYAHFTHVWRRTLELIRDALNGPMAEEHQEDADEDFITGRYIYVTSPVWGKCKVFVEQSGEGKQDILFLHTAGSDARQYHGVMNDSRCRQALNMYAFDLPEHGRSFPCKTYFPGAHTNTEESYIGCIAAVVKKLGLNKPIICGASMAGQVCIAAAIRYKEIGCSGTIPLQGSDHLDMERQWYDRSPYVNQALFNPEWIYGMMSPTAPQDNKRLIWHTYSAQGYGIFHGDLDFYFGGWDGRSRVASIDTKACPVYFLTGEYDWSNTPEMSQKTADKIPGAQHKALEGLGHFPATENPKRFIPHLLEAVDYIQKNRQA